MRLDQTLARLREQDRCALIVYLVAGDPSPQCTVDAMHAMVAAGTDVIELGVPCTDPIADGPVIESSHKRAISAGVGLSEVLAIVHEFRKLDKCTPVVLMTYMHPVAELGEGTFAAAANEAGADGVLVVDLPPEEAGPLVGALQTWKLHPIFLLGASTTDARVKTIATIGSGYLYYVSIRGVTGGRGVDPEAITRDLARVRRQTDVPLVVGFGIRDALSAKLIAAGADGVVLGTAIVDRLSKLSPESPAANAAVLDEVKRFLTGLSRAMQR